MEYVLSGHARTMMAEREIASSWIEQAMTDPERVESDTEDPRLEQRLARIDEHGGRVLRVILDRSRKPTRVVTAFFDRRMRNRL